MLRTWPGALVLCFLAATSLPAQQLSPEQEEVWTAVEAMIGHFADGEIEAAYDYVHPELVWWNTQNSVPGSHAEAWEIDSVWAERGGRWVGHTLRPLTVLVSDDLAVVNAYLRGFLQESAQDEGTFATTRLHFVMKKEDGRWVQLANYLHPEGN